MTELQRKVLSIIARQTEWCRVPIDRSGRKKDYAPARQWLAKQGFIVRHPDLRRTWKATPAGRDALAKEPTP